MQVSVEQFALAHPGGDGELQIQVALPVPPSPGVNLPVLYVVDGDLVFGLAAELVRILSTVEALPPCAVVGIGYGAAYLDFMKLRTADLSPPLRDGPDAMGAIGAMIGSERNGGADRFLSFLTTTLRDEIAARHPQTSGADTILFGHSLGGLFAAHALLTRPETFSRFLISSPSLWWDGFSILQELPAFAARLRAVPRQPRIFVDVGGREQDLPTQVPPGLGFTLEDAQAQIRRARMVDAAKEFADALRNAGAADLQHVAFAQEDHTSVAPAALIHGLRFALRQRD